MTGQSKFNFFVGFSPSVQDFFCYITCPISQFVPFSIKNPRNLSKICKKGTNCENLNLNNRKLGRLNVHVISQKSHVQMGDTLQKMKDLEKSLKSNCLTQSYKKQVIRNEL